jgi:hypothetical protein
MARPSETPRRFPDAAEDPANWEHQRDTPQTLSPSYRLAFADFDFLKRDELRPVRLQLELLKPGLELRDRGIVSTVVVFGGARIPETAEKARAPTRR